MVPRRVFFVLAALLSGAVVGYGGVITPCPMRPTDPAGSLPTFNSYKQQGSCTIGILRLYNFDLFTLDPSNNQTPATATLLNTITVDPVWNGSQLQMVIGGFTQFNVSATQTAGWLIRFTVDPPPVVVGEDVGFDPPFGFVSGNQDYCEDGVFGAGGCTGTPLSTGFTNLAGSSLRFSPALSILDTRTSIRLNPNVGTPSAIASGFDGVVFTISTTAAPEPSTLILIPAGLAIIGLARRRRR